jgi:hypothetical protein
LFIVAVLHARLVSATDSIAVEYFSHGDSGHAIHARVTCIAAR